MHQIRHIIVLLMPVLTHGEVVVRKRKVVVIMKWLLLVLLTYLQLISFAQNTYVKSYGPDSIPETGVDD